MEIHFESIDLVNNIMSNYKTLYTKTLDDNIKKGFLTTICEDLKQLRAKMADFKEQEALRSYLTNNPFDIFTFLNDIPTQCGQFKELCSQIYSFCLQFLVNFIHANVKNKDFIYNQIWLKANPSTFINTLQRIYEEAKLIRFSLILMNNLIYDWKTETLINCWKDNKFTYAMKKIINLLLDERYCHKNNQQHTNIDDQVFEWIYILIRTLLNQTSHCIYYQKEMSVLSIIWKLIDNDQVGVDNTEDICKTTWDELISNLQHLQSKKTIYFLFFLHNAFQKTIDEKSQASIIRDSNPRSDIVHEIYDKKVEFGISITSLDFKFLLRMYNSICEAILADLNKLTSNNFNDLNSIYNKFNIHMDHFHALIKIFSLLLFLGGHNKKVQDIFVNDNCFPYTLKVFDEVYKLENFLQEKKTLNMTIHNIINDDTYFELYLNLLRLISNIVHINPKAQNYILDNEYLILLLNFTKLDDKNPYIREWSIVLIRNLTDGNEVIKESISKLKMLDFDTKTKELLKKMVSKPNEVYEEEDENKDKQYHHNVSDDDE